MKKQSNALFTVFRDIIMLTTFVLAVILEHASANRVVLMIALFSVFFLWMHIRELFRDKYPKLLPYSFAADIVLLAMLDNSSKYVVNYYFNIYYFFALIAVAMMLQRKQSLITSFVVIFAAFIKYYRLIDVYNLTFILSYIIFTLAVFITVSVFFNYSRMLSEEKERLDKLNCELKAANEMLEERNERIKELTIFEERNRIARDIHDSVGHNLTGLVMNLDFCEKVVDIEPSKAKSQITACRDIARECLAEIRRSVQALKPQSVDQLPLVKSIQELINSSKQKFSIEIELRVKGAMYKTKPDFNIVIYRAVQEAITNSIRHGKATQVQVSVDYGEKKFFLFIKDNGCGTKELDMGNGLNGMIERVSQFKGEVNFFKNDGFMINIVVPMEGILNV
ncbi:MAG: sensor histidine kinase [Clostridia bacterium]|nr:sensor histidine kinase [Clostridia bacterium]